MTLARLKPSIANLSPRIGYAEGDERGFDRYRKNTQAWRQWYTTSRWQKLRWSVLVRDMFTCAKCNRIVTDTSQLVCDHVEPHRGDVHRFWAGPFQTLCKPCHDSAKQREEQHR